MSQPIKPMSNKELQALYNITEDVWFSWIKPLREKLGKQLGKVWNPNQVKIMIDHFGPPPGND